MSESPKSTKNSNNETSASVRSQAFTRIKTDLSSALQQWETLSAKAPELSADELRFQQMQQLLKELHEKMKALDFI